MTSNIVRRHLDGFLPLLSFLFDFELSMCVVSYLFLIHLISTSIHTTHSFNWRIHRIQKSRLIPAKICKIQTISTNNFKIGFINLYHCMAIATACIPYNTFWRTWFQFSRNFFFPVLLHRLRSIRPVQMHDGKCAFILKLTYGRIHIQYTWSVLCCVMYV